MRSLGDQKYYKLEDIFINNKDNDIVYRIGCDSINIKHNTIYITSLVGIYPNNKGAFVFYIKEKIPKIKEVQQRLWREVEVSVAFAKYLRDNVDITVSAIDFDLNVLPEYPSSRLAPAAVGFAMAEGFKAFTKPDKLYGINCSDHVCHNSGNKQKPFGHKNHKKIK